MTGTSGVPLMGREIKDNLLALAHYLAGAAPLRPSTMSLTVVALQEDQAVFEWWRDQFEKFSTDDETLWRIEQYRLAGDPDPDAVAVAIGPRSGTAMDATRFYLLASGIVHDAYPETDPARIAENRATVWAWGFIKRTQTSARSTCADALAHTRRAIDRAATNAHNPVLRRVAEIIAATDVMTWEDVAIACQALGLNPADMAWAAFTEAQAQQPATD